MKRNWKSRNSVYASDAERVQVEGPFPALIGRFLAVRGITEKEAIQSWLYPKLTDLSDPFTILGMKAACDRILQAFLNNEKVCIYADFDLDGTSGLALLYQGLKGLGFQDLIYYQPKRLTEGYGFHATAVQDLKSQNVSLIVTVDVGITALEACAKAKEIGLDVIITDHHLPGERLPEAFVVVNPNQSEDKSGLGYLCGAGVAYYLLRALKRRFVEEKIAGAENLDLKSVLDYFTIATLTDMVPLIEDNRTLVKLGLQVLQNTTHPGLEALLKALNLVGRPLTAQDVAIRFAPKLNALSRMETGIFPRDIMLEGDKKNAESLVSGVIKNNQTRVQLQADAEALADQMLESWSESDFIFLSSEVFHRGVVGLIATRLSQNHNKPCFIGSQNDEGVIVGSARLPNGSELCLVEAMSSSASILTRFGGHSAAAGFELHLAQREDFIQRLKTYFYEQKTAPKPIEIQYDLEANLEDINNQLMTWYDFLGPFGSGFQAPLFRFSDLRLISRRELKGGHLRLEFEGQYSQRTEALLFSPTSAQIQITRDLVGSKAAFEVLGEMQWNYFAGQKKVQLLIREIRPEEANSISAIGRDGSEGNNESIG